MREPMIQIRKSKERGFADHGWLKSRHTFSFASYNDPNHMGFRTLRVINEDRIEGGTGFGAHPHRDMEIISYVVKGALEHKDSMGTQTIIRPGEVQRMSAGSGIVHSEFNANKSEVAHFFQIWILPNSHGQAPDYGQKSFASQLNEKNLVLVVSENGRDDSISIKQDADIYISRMKANESFEFSIRPHRGAWIQLVHGKVEVNGVSIETGDAVSIETSSKNSTSLHIKSHLDSEFILFDLK